MEVCSKKTRAHFQMEGCSDFFRAHFHLEGLLGSCLCHLSCICQCKDIHGSVCLTKLRGRISRPSLLRGDVGPVRWRHRAELAPAAAPLAVAVAAALADGDLDEEAITEDKRDETKIEEDRGT